MGDAPIFRQTHVYTYTQRDRKIRKWGKKYIDTKIYTKKNVQSKYESIYSRGKQKHRCKKVP